MPKSLELLSRSIKFYKENFKAILEILAVPLVLWALLLMFGIAGTTASFMTGYGFFATVVIFIVVIVAIVASVWQQVALYYFLNTKDKSLRAMDYYKASKDRLFPYFVTSFLAALVTFAGFLLLIVPGIIFFIRYSMANIIAVTENIEATAALRKSKEYVKGHWGQVAGRFSVLILAAMFIFLSLSFFLAFMFGEDSIVGGMIFNLVVFLIAPVFSVYVFEIYKYLKEIKQTAPKLEAVPEPNGK